MPTSPPPPGPPRFGSGHPGNDDLPGYVPPPGSPYGRRPGSPYDPPTGRFDPTGGYPGPANPYAPPVPPGGGGPPPPPAPPASGFSFPPGGDQVRLGLVGAASGGKTTYLGTLSYAVERRANHQSRYGGPQWQMNPTNDMSRDFVANLRQKIEDRRFPLGTEQASELTWRVQGAETTRTTELLPWKRTSVTRPIDFYLDVADLPGEDFLMNDNKVAVETLRRMAATDALVVLFDPTLELDKRPGAEGTSNYQYLDKLVYWMKTEAQKTGRNIAGRLIQEVALCVTKFDEPSLFRAAYQAGFIQIKADGFPRIPDDLASDYFMWLDRLVRGEGHPNNVERVRDLLEANFRRVTYYAMSSIGFHRDERGEFDPNGDCGNVVYIDGEKRIRGPVYPVNVLEPLIDLERRIRAAAS